MICHDKKCIFIHIPKCAGTSIESVMGHLAGYEGYGGQDHRSIRMIETPLLSSAALRSRENLREIAMRARVKCFKTRNPRNKLTVTSNQYRDYYKFTIVRNPWARAFSWYKNVIRDSRHRRTLGITSDIPFNDFIALHAGKGMLRPQMYWLVDFKGQVPLDYIARFENLHEDFQHICQTLALKDTRLPHQVKGTGEDYRLHYNDRSIEIVDRIYQEEIRRFGYTFE